ncbi:MAG: glutamate--tRNA ligase [Desulfovibrionaceae bacterium]|nr:glutamate--tRNA ligase [Desulfovibrionaceae bacterium]
MMKVVTRFAPSPTGHLHLGGARTAIFNWLFTRHHQGKFYLRIEDTDTLRSKQEYTDSILASMNWLGLDWDGEPVYQSERFDLYNQYVDRLLESGHAYWCSCSPEDVEKMREEARARGENPKYNGCCRDRGLRPSPGNPEKMVVRLRAPQTGITVLNDMVKGEIVFNNAELDDMVLRRPDGAPTYNMAVVVDDIEMGMTHVIRGDDHVPNTPKQILIYQALGAELPIFGHVPMILGPDKQKLSKRHGATAVIDYEKEGLLPEALVNYLTLLGWSHGNDEFFGLEDLVREFANGRLNPSPSAFDPEKLAWLNHEHMKTRSSQELAELVAPFIKALELPLPAPEKLLPLVEMLRERAQTLKDLAAAMKFMLIDAAQMEYDQKALEKTITPESRAHLAALRSLFDGLPEFDASGLHDALHGYVEGNGLKFKQVGPPLRVALVGALAGPDLCQVMSLLGKEQTLARLTKFQ